MLFSLSVGFLGGQVKKLTSVSKAWVLLMSIRGGNMPPEKGKKLVMKGETLAAATTAAIWFLACSVGDCAAGCSGKLLPATTAPGSAPPTEPTPTPPPGTPTPLPTASDDTDTDDDDVDSFTSRKLAAESFLVALLALLLLTLQFALLDLAPPDVAVVGTLMPPPVLLPLLS